ncbi:cwfJ-like family protein [Artemisia annua]|uniref:CwfJ-like family protein n=1 Tax=Artemisia annua TaxID=35608 RepID=A0A2U1N5Y8_ARTAN|nr:cwfJ-like family protein [Artemisia annua]
MLTTLAKQEKEAGIFPEPVVDIFMRVTVNDDESWWKSGYGVNVIRGMLSLPGEYMHRHHRHETVHIQKQVVANLDLDRRTPFDWTEQLYL